SIMTYTPSLHDALPILFYYNALFNFAIYYGWLLAVALSVAVWIERRISNRPAVIRIAGLIALTLLVASALIRERRHFRAAPDPKDRKSTRLNSSHVEIS